jgi:DNA-binding MarR family transcriptional regulator
MSTEARIESVAEDSVETATRVFATMRNLVLERDDRRAEVARALGMSFSRSKALRGLVAGPMTMSELTARITTDKPYTTLIVDDLERRGLVERSVHPDDRRSKIVTITPAGIAAAALAEEILAQPPTAMLALDPEELAALDRVMAKLRTAPRTLEPTDHSVSLDPGSVARTPRSAPCPPTPPTS